MTLTRHWAIPKTGDGQCICPECGWSGKASNCDPRIDSVALCPECGHWVEYRDPPKDNTVRRPR